MIMMTPRSITKQVPLALALAVLAGCGGGGASNNTVEPEGPHLQYNPLGGGLPSPNDLAFQGSQDGTLNAPVAQPATADEPLDSGVSVNSLDGFSTIAGITANFTAPVDGSTITPGDTVRVFAVDTQGDPNSASGNDPAGPKGVTGIDAADPYAASNGELVPGTHFTAGRSPANPNGTTLAITPLQPLVPDQTYMVVVTDGIQAQGGGAIAASREYQLLKSGNALTASDGSSLVDGLSDEDAQQLAALQPLIGSHLAAAGSAQPAIAPGNVIASWTFTTQTVGGSLAAARAEANGAQIAFADSSGNANSLTGPVTETPNPSGPSAGNVFAGALAGVPYYLEPGDTDPTRVLSGFWTASDGEPLVPGSRTPSANDTLNIPVLVALPKSDGNAPSDVVIFQHGITSNRSAMLGIANTLTANNHAVVAIDLPLHGIADDSDPLYAGSSERHFNVDLVNNATGAAGSDGEIDPSGEHFINLSSLRTSRDNLRQGVADLFALTRAIRLAASQGVDFDGDGDADFNSNISFLGHSLGGIVGVPYLALEDDLDAAVLGMAGSGIAKLLDGSPEIGPQIEAGLAANGLVKGSPAYEQFLGAAQTVIDKAEPANHAAMAAANHNTLSIEVVGGSSSPADQVVPNNLVEPYQQGVPSGTIPSPTAGTDPLATFMGALPGNQIDANPGGAGDYLIRYTAGDHASLLSPDASAAATSEMQTNAASFIASDGTTVQFAGTGTVAAP
jgi:dienelactone hydrolase